MSCRVLIADDAPDVRMLLRTVIEAEGFDVVGEARNGVEAVEMAGAEGPDVILLDLSMPVMDGLEAMPAILEAKPATRIIVLSGFVSAEVKDRVSSLGAAACIEKGARLDELLATLRGLCLDDEAAEPSGGEGAAR